MLAKQLLDILVCPSCRAKVELKERAEGDGEGIDGWLACTGCDLIYPVRNGIPVMLIDEAKKKTTEAAQ